MCECQSPAGARQELGGVKGVVKVTCKSNGAAEISDTCTFSIHLAFQALFMLSCEELKLNKTP